MACTSPASATEATSRPSRRRRRTPTPPATRGPCCASRSCQRRGARPRPLDAIPERVDAMLDLPGPPIGVPDRLVELIGAGPNGWTAQEGALKIREAAYIAAEGLSSEQFFHGPSVALDEQDTLVVLDGGGPAAGRTEAIAGAVEVTGRGSRGSPSAARRGAVGVPAHRGGAADRPWSWPRRAASALTAFATTRIPVAKRRSRDSVSERGARLRFPSGAAPPLRHWLTGVRLVGRSGWVRLGGGSRGGAARVGFATGSRSGRRIAIRPLPEGRPGRSLRSRSDHMLERARGLAWTLAQVPRYAKGDTPIPPRRCGFRVLVRRGGGRAAFVGCRVVEALPHVFDDWSTG